MTTKINPLLWDNSFGWMYIFMVCCLLKFIYSEKATKFYEIFTLLLSYVVPVKNKVKILQNFEAFSEYMNLTNDVRFYGRKVVRNDPKNVGKW